MARPIPICSEGEIGSQSRGVGRAPIPAVNKSVAFDGRSVPEFWSYGLENFRVCRALVDLCNDMWLAQFQ